VISLTAFSSGEASLKTTFGSGVLGLGGRKEISDQTKNIILSAQKLLDQATPTEEYASVKPKNVFFYLLTTSGVRCHEARLKDFPMRKDPFWEIFHRFSTIKNYADRMADMNRANKKA